MVKRRANCGTEEPVKSFPIPSPGEHLFQVVDVLYFDTDENVVHAKCEVVGGVEEGRTLLHRLNIDENGKGFFATRVFLKAIGEEYKGEIEIDTERWPGKRFLATVIHNGKYANIDEFNFDKPVNQPVTRADKVTSNEKAWDE